MLMKRISELEHIMANLIQDNKHLEERLDSHGACLYTLENQDTSADIKEILHQRIWVTNSYKTHKDHMMLYEALEKSMNRDHTNELLKDLAEARKKKKKSRDSLNTPPGSPPHQPPPPSPPAAPSSSKTAASAEYKAWITSDTRIGPSISSTPKDLHMDDDMSPDAQAYSSDDEDIRNAHILMASALASTYSPPLEDLLLAQTGDIPALSISKIKVAYYPNVGLEQMVPDQMWIEEECKFDIAAIIEVFSMYGYDYMKKIILCRVDLNEHIIVERDFKYLYPSDFKDLYLLNLQGHLNHLPPKDKKILTTAVNLWTRHLVIRQHVKDFQLRSESYQTQLNLTKPRSDATSFEYKHDYTIDEALDYWVKEFKVNRMNPANELTDAFEKPFESMGFNSLVHSLRALSTLRRSDLRTASAAAKPCQGDSLELYLITGSIYTDQRETVVLATLFNENLQHSFRNSDACYYDQEKCGHAGPKVITSQEGNTPQQG
nr:hypothetical protein [Tanacetum cinerariifolium]GEV88728.1 hypothetical protein [Tanacetum cinerariifolium]